MPRDMLASRTAILLIFFLVWMSKCIVQEYPKLDKKNRFLFHVCLAVYFEALLRFSASFVRVIFRRFQSFVKGGFYELIIARKWPHNHK